LRFLRDHMPGAPDDLGIGVAFVSAPREPFVPPELQHQPILGLVVCWSGALELRRGEVRATSAAPAAFRLAAGGRGPPGAT
jgi:hypothetical protein